MSRTIFKAIKEKVGTVPAFIIASAAVFGLLISIYFWRQKQQERFPRLLAGSYLGVIKEALATEETPFYIEQDSQGNQALVVVLRNGWQPQIVTFLDPDSSDDDLGYYPISIVGAEEQLRLVGTAISGVSYAGVVRNLSNNRNGTWRLGRVADHSSAQPAQANEMVRLWLLLRSELEVIEKDIQQNKQDYETKAQEAEQLASFISEGQTLKNRGEQKFNEVRSELRELRVNLEQKQAQARSLEEKINISQKVTRPGRLVSLARETFDRENRWIDTEMKSDLAAEPAATISLPSSGSESSRSTAGDINSQYD